MLKGNHGLYRNGATFVGGFNEPSIFDGASVAFSLRIPANSTYNGPLIRVRRSSDNSELDIYATSIFDTYGNRVLDTVSLLNFTGIGSGFVTTFYNQSGVGGNMVQSSLLSQPRIVNAGVVETANNKPAIYSESGKKLSVNPAPWLITGNNNRCLNAVLTRTAGNNIAVWSGAHISGLNNVFGIDMASNLTFCPYTYGTGNTSSVAVSTNTTAILVANRNNGVSSSFVNGVLKASNSIVISTNTVNGFGIGTRPDGNSCTGHYSEIVYFPFNLPTGSQQRLELSQSQYFGITLS